MFAISWLELGEAEKAQRLLEKCFKNIQGPFQVSNSSVHMHIHAYHIYIMNIQCVITSPHRYGVSHRTALVL